MAAKQVAPRTLVLAAAALAALVVLVAIWPRGTADTTGSSPGGPRAPQAADPAIPPPLGLEGMQAPRATPANRRDLFRFGSAAPAGGEETGEGGNPVARPAGRRGAAPAAAEPTAVPEGPVMPPPPPPIPLRLVGLIQTGRVPLASLTDGKFVYNAKEGDTVEGRWRVVKIGAESVVIERIDGTGRQTLRLPGG